MANIDLTRSGNPAAYYNPNTAPTPTNVHINIPATINGKPNTQGTTYVYTPNGKTITTTSGQAQAVAGQILREERERKSVEATQPIQKQVVPKNRGFSSAKGSYDEATGTFTSPSGEKQSMSYEAALKKINQSNQPTQINKSNKPLTIQDVVRQGNVAAEYGKTLIKSPPQKETFYYGTERPPFPTIFSVLPEQFVPKVAESSTTGERFKQASENLYQSGTGRILDVRSNAIISPNTIVGQTPLGAWITAEQDIKKAESQKMLLAFTGGFGGATKLVSTGEKAAISALPKAMPKIEQALFGITTGAKKSIYETAPEYISRQGISGAWNTVKFISGTKIPVFGSVGKLGVTGGLMLGGVPAATTTASILTPAPKNISQKDLEEVTGLVGEALPYALRNTKVSFDQTFYAKTEYYNKIYSDAIKQGKSAEEATKIAEAAIAAETKTPPEGQVWADTMTSEARIFPKQFSFTDSGKDIEIIKGETWLPKNIGINVPLLGTLTSYDLPGIGYLIGDIGDIVFGKKPGVYSNVKELATQELIKRGYSPDEAVQGAEYLYKTKFFAGAIGESIALTPGLGAFEETTAQVLLKGGFTKAFKKEGLTFIAEKGLLTNAKNMVQAIGTKKAAEIVTKASIVPLTTAGIYGGVGSTYIQSQARAIPATPQQYGINTIFATGTAVIAGIPIARWGFTRPATSKALYGIVNAGDITEAPSDIFSDLYSSKLRTGDKAMLPIQGTKNKIFTVQKPVKVKTKTTTTSTGTTTPTNIFIFTQTPTTSTTPTDTTTPTEIITPTTIPTFIPTITSIFTPTITPIITPTTTPTTTTTTTTTETITPTTTYTPTMTPTTTFTAALPLIPLLGFDGSPFGEGTGRTGKRKYYNELQAALGSFRSLDYGLIKSKKKRRTVLIGGQLYKVGKKVKVKKK